MSASLTLEIVEQQDCIGHHLDLFMEFHRSKSSVMRYCGPCAENFRKEIARAMRDRVINGDDEGVPI